MNVLPLNASLTVKQLLRWAKNCLLGTAQEGDDRILLAHVLGKNSAQLIAHEDRILAAVQIADYKKLISKRQAGIPVAYLTGNKEFWSMPIRVNEQVLIPRHETEILVEQVLQLLDGLDANARILELGTGSGAIALALASELPDAQITATDNALSALAVARSNQLALSGLVTAASVSELSNIQFLHSDWFENIATEKYHLICSNPPYLSADDIHLQQGDLRFEPRTALVAGGDDADGYMAMTHIVIHAKSYLHQSGWLVLEHGFEQGQGVRQLLADYDYNDIVTHQDLSGNDRVAVARAD